MSELIEFIFKYLEAILLLFVGVVLPLAMHFSNHWKRNIINHCNSDINGFARRIDKSINDAKERIIRLECEIKHDDKDFLETMEHLQKDISRIADDINRFTNS